MTRALSLAATAPGEIHAAFASLLDTLNARNGRDGVALQVADRLWGQQDVAFEPEYLRLLGDRYHAPLEKVDFVRATEKARVAINRHEDRRGAVHRARRRSALAVEISTA